MRLHYLLLLMCSLMCVACGSKKPPAVAPPPTDVKAFEIEPKTIPAVFDFIGFADSSHPVEIRARVEGYLDKIAYQEGQMVKEGDLLFQLDPRQYMAKVEQAKAEVARQEALVENAKLTVERLAPLYKQKAASKKDLDNAIANQLSTQASFLAAKAQLLNNQIDLDYTTIRSPITGLADKAKSREGALINPGLNSLLTTVSVLNPIWVYFTVSDNDILRAQQQSINKSLTLLNETEYEVEVILSDGSKFPRRGKVDFSSPTYDQSTGSLLARAVLPNPDNGLRPGQFVRVKVYGAERPNAIFIPQRALLQKKDGVYVYLISEDNKVVAQDVSTGSWYGNYQIITNGLKPGDRIIVDGINKVRPGMPVKVTGTWNDPNKKDSPSASPSSPPSTPKG